MTEAEWLSSTNCDRMLELLRDHFNVNRRRKARRKILLFAVACCRRFSYRIKDARSQRFVETLERYADGAVDWRQVDAAEAEAHEVTEGFAIAYGMINMDGYKGHRGDQYHFHQGRRIQSAWERAWAASHVPWLSTWGPSAATLDQFKEELLIHPILLRDIFGNPFRPPARLSSAVSRWNECTVRRIAEGIYEERAFDRLSVLADALLDAGCDNEDLIQHCRGEGPHVRGCWALDLILGKE